MKVSSFKRGLKVPGHKGATEGTEAVASPIPSEVVIPVTQHLGAPNKALVKEGDAVKRGQKIAECATGSPMAVPVHASIAGVVKKIESRPLMNNSEGLCIIIEGDGTEKSLEDTDFLPALDPFSCTKEEALARIKEAGIIGMGGAGFPTYVKLNPPPNLKIDTIIADGAECEPFLTTDEACITKKTDTLLRGLAIVMRVTGVTRAVIGMEDNKERLVALLEERIAALKYPGSITIGLCKTRYPQGGEKLLITALTGREVPSGKLPGEAGCIVQNVGTLIAIAEAFDGKPLIERTLTISGGACRKPRNVIAPIGAIPANFPPDFLSIDYDSLAKIISGGPMMGFALPRDTAPIQKNTSGLLYLTADETVHTEESSCIRCGRCVTNCSARLYPTLMNEALNAGEVREAERLGLLDCFECGACTYMCPAHIKLTQRFRVGKSKLRALQQAEQAKQAAAAANAAAAADKK